MEERVLLLIPEQNTFTTDHESVMCSSTSADESASLAVVSLLFVCVCVRMNFIFLLFTIFESFASFSVSKMVLYYFPSL